MQIRELPGVSYVRFDPAGGFSCAQAVQNCASLDADLILAENLQDPPTLLAAARAAEQGRLVLAGMGAASVGSALAVLREMNLSDWPLASVLLGVVAVATVRRLCPHCKQAHEPSAAMLSDLGLGCEKFTLPLYLAKGCPKCAQTGYAGTIPLVSILKTDRIIAAMIRRGEMAEVIEQAGKSSGLRTLRQAAMEHLRSGATSISEVARACPPEL
jgi:type II secretory ATPase GspE/PulE/Tfp pilus assembly ATPase PilB-like protein